MFAAALRGTGRHSRRTRLRATATGVRRAWPWRRCWPPAAESSSDANQPAGTYHVKVTDGELPDRAAARPDLAAAARRPQHRQEDRAGADRDDLDRRQGGPGLLAALRRPRSAARPRPARPAGLGAGADLPAPGRLLRARRRHHLEPQDLLLRAAEAGRDDRRGLEAERGQSRQVHPRSTGSTPASAAPPRRRPTAASRPAAPSSPRSPPCRPNTEVTDNGEVVEISNPSAEQVASRRRARRAAAARCWSLALALGAARPAARPATRRQRPPAARPGHRHAPAAWR